MTRWFLGPRLLPTYSYPGDSEEASNQGFRRLVFHSSDIYFVKWMRDVAKAHVWSSIHKTLLGNKQNRLAGLQRGAGPRPTMLPPTAMTAAPWPWSEHLVGLSGIMTRLKYRSRWRYSIVVVNTSHTCCNLQPFGFKHIEDHSDVRGASWGNFEGCVQFIGY